MANISFQEVPVLLDGHDTVGTLVFVDGQLAAVLSRLDGEYHDDRHKGGWHLEAGLGRCERRGTHVFRTLADAKDWVGRVHGA